MNHADPIGNIENYMVLAYAILVPIYMCPEKAFYYFHNNVPYNINRKWMTADITDEIVEYVANGQRNVDVANLLGVSESIVSRLVRGRRKLCQD